MSNKKSYKKPTMNQVKSVIDNVLLHLSEMQQQVNQLDGIFASYIKFRNQEKDFKNFLEKELKKYNDKQSNKSSTKGNAKNEK